MCGAGPVLPPWRVAPGMSHLEAENGTLTDFQPNVRISRRPVAAHSLRIDNLAGYAKY
jgi:hypothetical protein